MITACTKAVNSWNYAVQNTSKTSNMGFSFTKSTNKDICSIRFLGENQASETWYGLARYYVFSGSSVTRVSNAYNRDYTSCILNIYYYDSTFSFPTAAHWMEIAAHEMGHGLGLAHTTDKGTLMYPNFDTSTAVSPTGDEVSGVYEKYK